MPPTKLVNVRFTPEDRSHLATIRRWLANALRRNGMGGQPTRADTIRLALVVAARALAGDLIVMRRPELLAAMQRFQHNIEGGNHYDRDAMAQQAAAISEAAIFAPTELAEELH